MTAFSVLELARVTDTGGPRQALLNACDLARHAEQWGYRRFWVAEHHNMAGIASAATSVVIGQLAAATQTIRVGAGGIMLPNHSPLVIAEQFGTLAQLFPGRIDLGLGRAPGTDPLTVRALRRSAGAAEHFAEDVLELQRYFAPDDGERGIKAVPATGTQVPLWILGSSLYGASLAAEFGLPYAFASHFAPEQLLPALAVYRHRFRPSEVLAKPYAMVGVNIIVADTDAEAARLATTQQMSFVRLLRGNPGLSTAPIDDMDSFCTPAEQAHARQMLARSLVGSPARVQEQLAALIEETGADEFMVVTDIYDHTARLHSLSLLAEIAQKLR